MKCKPGDAVVVVGPTCSRSPSAIGHFGTVARWVMANVVDQIDGQAWMSRKDGWFVELATRPTGWDVAFSVFPDSSLMPIRPGAEDNSEGQDAREGMVAHG